MISVITVEPPPWDTREIMRYARVKEEDEHLAALLRECITEAEPVLTYKVSYSVVDVKRDGERISFGTVHTGSSTVSRALTGCDKALVFAVTVGTPFDRLIAKYSKLSPTKALLLQAIGAERAEALCDSFSALFEKNYHVRLKPRISPGYGDFMLEHQRDFFAMLDCPRKIGLTLNASLLMLPSKSVTAVAGISDEAYCSGADRCDGCPDIECLYRKQR